MNGIDLPKGMMYLDLLMGESAGNKHVGVPVANEAAARAITSQLTTLILK